MNNIINRIKIIAGIFLACLYGCGQKQGYILTGELSGAPENQVIELIPGATHKNEKPEAETTVKNGVFVFAGNTEIPKLYYLKLKDFSGIYSVFIENGKINLTGKVELTDNEGQKFAVFKDVNVTGSESHNLYKEKKEYSKFLDAEYRKLNDIRQKTDKTKEDSLNLAKMEKDFFHTVEQMSTKAILDNKDTWWGPFLMLDIMNRFSEAQQSWFTEFSPEAQNSYYGQIVKRELFPKSFVGSPVPEFSVTKEGKDFAFADLAKGKKLVLIDFWASWCAPCRKEIPELKKIYEEFSSKGFEIISISIDDNKESWQNAVEKEQMSWPNFLDETKTAKELFNVRAIPATFLVDESGKIILENFRSNTLREKLGELGSGN
ncbi:MAG: AhpC/TSA family protein [Prevotellaceae bacterium]|jgi:thiol-disulfide isomerase/thioredoxin|nr:AhpC/TSA family protein [Prevotellaceae bacterium]